VLFSAIHFDSNDTITLKKWQLALHCHLRPPVPPVALGFNHETLQQTIASSNLLSCRRYAQRGVVFSTRTRLSDDSSFGTVTSVYRRRGLFPVSLESSTLPLGTHGFLWKEAVDVAYLPPVMGVTVYAIVRKCWTDDVFQLLSECVHCVSWSAEQCWRQYTSFERVVIHRVNWAEFIGDRRPSPDAKLELCLC